MQIKDVLDRADTSLDQLEGDDAELLSVLHEIQANGGTLTPEQEAQANDALSRIETLHENDRAAIDEARATLPPVTTTDTGTGGTDEGTGSTGTEAGTAEESSTTGF